LGAGKKKGRKEKGEGRREREMKIKGIENEKKWKESENLYLRDWASRRSIPQIKKSEFATRPQFNPQATNLP
jgi:hypothetical protein